MGKAIFYHLTRSTVEETLRILLPRAVDEGWPVFVRGRDAARLARLDEALWLLPEDSFLPHGLEGGPHDAHQPVLLGQGRLPAQAKVLALISGAGVQAAEVAALERLWVIFDSADEAEMTGARALWREVAAMGIDAEYWSEESGRWTKKQERKSTTGA